ncbi:hypothetical protein ACTWPT_31855 [Nonomuraea sp. 3N208]|uniref:hypothetical protein n=1 Tax=Nonomuraea sp. 3N208 TaxID=3457421 RepID=UPI003FD1AF44
MAGGTVPPSSSPGSPRAEPAHRRFRGKNKTRAWKRDKDQPVSVIRLPLIVDDPQTRDRVEQLFAAAWSLKRALQRDARARVDAYWAGTYRRQADPKEWRATLGLTRVALEHAAYAHLDNSGYLLHHLTKALALHIADEVWTGVDRHLFADSRGKHAGRPKTGSFWAFTRIPGRARSHTTARKWETFRLHGTLDGHLAAYPHPDLISHLTAQPRPGSGPAPGTEAWVAAALTLPPTASVLAQPRRLRPPGAPTGRITLTTTTSTMTTGSVTTGKTRTRPASWWDHTGPLAVVYTGGPRSGRGDLVLPVRLPQGAGRAPYLAHYLARPQLWHKIDLVRRRDPSAPGGWTYEAHLMILDTGYASPATRQRRARAVGLQRRAGIDGNVSNLSVVSAPATGDPADGPVRADQVTLTPAEHARLAGDRRKAKRRSRALDRSRRAGNPDRYEPSRRQAKRARRRQEADLPARQITVPRGGRVANAAGKPRNAAYHTDTLSSGYRKLRAIHAAAAVTRTAARKARARQVAADLVAVHGTRLVVEDCDIRTWFRLWGRTLAAFTPGQLIAAIEREAIAAGGTLLRASTTTTAMSQHCPCGTRVPKSLRERTHACPICGLTAPRDLISALLASCVTHSDPADLATACVDYSHAERLLTSYTMQGLQEALSESTAIDPTPTTAVSTVADAGQAAAIPTPRHGQQGRPLLGEIPQPVPRRPRMRPHPHPTGPGPRRTDVPTGRTIPPLRDSS